MANCNGKTHDLKDIYRERVGSGETNVVRWCQTCGAVVVDVDVDNRTAPGGHLKMLFPENTKK